MKCKKYQDQFMDLLYGELSGRPLDDVNKHLQSCSECRSALTQLQEVRGVLGGLSDVGVPQHLSAKVIAQGSRKSHQIHVVKWMFSPTFSMAAGFLFLISTSLLVYNHMYSNRLRTRLPYS